MCFVTLYPVQADSRSGLIQRAENYIPRSPNYKPKNGVFWLVSTTSLANSSAAARRADDYSWQLDSIHAKRLFYRTFLAREENIGLAQRGQI